MMQANTKLKMSSPQTILRKRGLDKSGQCQKFFTNEVARLSDPYVPMRTGTLKNSVRQDVDRIMYVTPYAKPQYYGNRGTGMRGKLWVKRMMADKGRQLLAAVAAMAGGRSKP